MDPGLVHGGVHGPSPCLVLSSSRRSVSYKAQEVLHHLHGNFAVPDNINDFESDIEEFESGEMTMI